MDSAMLVARREPAERMLFTAPEPSLLRRRRRPRCGMPDGAFPPRPARGFTPGNRGALLRARRECCCPGLRRKYGTSQPIRLRSRRR
jgi:hypothetical protein